MLILIFAIFSSGVAGFFGELKPHVNTNLDSVILFKSRSEKWLDKEFWGKEDDLTSFII